MDLDYYDANNCTDLVSDGGNGGGCVCDGPGGIWEISTSLSILLYI